MGSKLSFGDAGRHLRRAAAWRLSQSLGLSKFLRARWERHRPGGQTFPKPHAAYLHRFPSVDLVFHELLPARRRSSQQTEVYLQYWGLRQSADFKRIRWA